MIPEASITQWRQRAPWPQPHQVEQDLALSRALVEIFSDDFLAQRLALRGGTALHKLFLAPARRYSEDIDLVQVQASGAPVGETMDRLRLLLSPWLGEPRYKVARGMATQVFRFTSEGLPPIPLRLKVEMNYEESFSLLPLEQREFSVENRWFQGSASVRVNHPDELLATKLRALYQRRKGRDLFDLVVALDEVEVRPQAVVRCFYSYLELQGLRISRREYESNLEAKLATPAFLEDLIPLLPSGVVHDAKEGVERIREAFLTLLE